MTLQKRGCERSSDAGAAQVLKSGAALVGAAYGFDYVLKSAYHRHSVEHQRRHEFEGVLGEMRANRLAKFEQPRPIPPGAFHALLHGLVAVSVSLNSVIVSGPIADLLLQQPMTSGASTSPRWRMSRN